METIRKLSPLTEASYYVLLAFNKPNHGYGVIKQVEELTDKRLVIAAGTLYGIINSFLKHQLIVLIEKSGGRSKKTYEITELGRQLLEYEIDRLESMSIHGKEVLK